MLIKYKLNEAEAIKITKYSDKIFENFMLKIYFIIDR